MVCGDIPFETDSDIKRAFIQFREGLNLSEDLKDLIRSCLTISTKHRISLQELSQHRWMKPTQVSEYEGNQYQQKVTSMRLSSSPVQFAIVNSKKFTDQSSNESDRQNIPESSLASDSSCLMSAESSFDSQAAIPDSVTTKALFCSKDRQFTESKKVYGEDRSFSNILTSDEEYFFTVDDQISPQSASDIPSMSYSVYYKSEFPHIKSTSSMSPCFLASPSEHQNVACNIGPISFPVQSARLPPFCQIKH